MSNSRANAIRVTNAYIKASDPSSYVPVLVAIYNGLLRHLDGAKRDFERHQPAQCMLALGKVTEVLNGLQRNLNQDASPTLAKNLSTFYDFNIVAVSTLVGVKFERKAYEGIVARLTMMRDAWSEVAGIRQSQELDRNRPALDVDPVSTVF